MWLVLMWLVRSVLVGEVRRMLMVKLMFFGCLMCELG